LGQEIDSDFNVDDQLQVNENILDVVELLGELVDLVLGIVDLILDTLRSVGLASLLGKLSNLNDLDFEVDSNVDGDLKVSGVHLGWGLSLRNKIGEFVLELSVDLVGCNRSEFRLQVVDEVVDLVLDIFGSDVG